MTMCPNTIYIDRPRSPHQNCRNHKTVAKAHKLILLFSTSSSKTRSNNNYCTTITATLTLCRCCKSRAVATSGSS